MLNKIFNLLFLHFWICLFLHIISWILMLFTHNILLSNQMGKKLVSQKINVSIIIKKNYYKNYFTNFYNKIQQIIMININKNIFTKKMYVVSVTSLKISDKKICSSFFYVIISCIMFSNKLKNELFWSQVILQNTKKKNSWHVYVSWILTMITEVTCFLIWSVKYNSKKNELKHKF